MTLKCKKQSVGQQLLKFKLSNWHAQAKSALTPSCCLLAHLMCADCLEGFQRLRSERWLAKSIYCVWNAVMKPPSADWLNLRHKLLWLLPRFTHIQLLQTGAQNSNLFINVETLSGKKKLFNQTQKRRLIQTLPGATRIKLERCC